MNTIESAPLVLTIDDEAAMREVIAGVADLAGYRTMGASGKQGISRALEQTADVIILDISMPEMDGIEVIWELVKRKSTASLIVLSGFDQSVLQAAEAIARQSGLNLVKTMTKPVNVSELRSLLISLRTIDAVEE
jgi:CheY-like chemotaxis protein